MTLFSILKDCFLGENGVFPFIGSKIMTLQINNIPLLSWIIGLVIFSGILTILVSLRPRISLSGSKSFTSLKGDKK